MLKCASNLYQLENKPYQNALKDKHLWSLRDVSKGRVNFKPSFARPIIWRHRDKRTAAEIKIAEINS